MPHELEWLGGPERLPELLAASDFVLVACDMNDEKVGLIGAEQLAQLKLGGVVINVALGRIIDEHALYEALAFKRIGGAIFYVRYSYFAVGEEAVWTCQQPFQELENTLLSEHRSALTAEMHERRWRFVAENCARVAFGGTRHNIVLTGQGSRKDQRLLNAFS